MRSPLLLRALAGFMSCSMPTSRGLLGVVVTTDTDTVVPSPRASIARSTTSAMISSTGLVGSATSLSSAVTSLGFPLLLPACFADPSRLWTAWAGVSAAVRSRSLSARSLRFLARWRSRSYARFALRTMLSPSAKGEPGWVALGEDGSASDLGWAGAVLTLRGREEVREERRARRAEGVVNTGIAMYGVLAVIKVQWYMYGIDIQEWGYGRTKTKRTRPGVVDNGRWWWLW